MKQSKLFQKTSKESPKGIESVSHNLLLRAGFIDQLMAGVYTFLPLGLAVLKKIEDIVRKNMESDPINGQEILMPSLTPKENWQKTGRWNNFESLFKIEGYGLAPTHEEIVSPLAQKFILSYRDLPLYLFQIQTKFRNEARAKSGILRTREFIMKDLYSFHSSENDLNDYYEKVAEAYSRIFKECGIGKATYRTLAKGGTFSKFSHEYQAITDAGEDIIYICSKCGIATNKEIYSGGVCENCGKKSDFTEKKAVEVGNIFKLGTKFSEPFNLKFRDKSGKENFVIMGCYGLGLGRILGAIAELNSDKNGLIWPESVAPYKVHLIQIDNSSKEAEKIYNNLQKNNIEVLYDDRENKTAGEKFIDSDLTGIPIRIVVSKKTLSKNSVEIKKRNEKESRLIKTKDLIKTI